MNRFLVLAWALLTVSGCATPVYELRSGRVHKDMVVCNVLLEAALPTDAYQQIAEKELHRLLTSPAAIPDDDLPLYEARFVFLIAGPEEKSFHRIATVHFSLLSPGSLPRVVLYPQLF